MAPFEGRLIGRYILGVDGAVVSANMAQDQVERLDLVLRQQAQRSWCGDQFAPGKPWKGGAPAGGCVQDGSFRVVWMKWTRRGLPDNSRQALACGGWEEKWQRSAAGSQAGSGPLA